MAFGELEFLEWLRQTAGAHPAIQVGIGDDMAVVALQTNRMLMASDMLLDGVHFDSRIHALGDIGRKTVARNLSDCAAMAVRPLAATVSVALPKQMNETDVQDLFRGIMGIAAEFEVGIAGGDTARWAHPLAIDVAIIAEPYPETPPVLRSGARTGDRLYVTGTLGGSLLGRHMTFTPRVREAQQLARFLGGSLHSMIDISDGLGLDLWRMCQASNRGARLEEELMLGAASDDARRAAAADGRPLLEHVLADGEDHELLIAVDGDASAAPVPLLPLGTIISAARLECVDRAGRSRSLPPMGYVHQ